MVYRYRTNYYTIARAHFTDATMRCRIKYLYPDLGVAAEFAMTANYGRTFAKQNFSLNLGIMRLSPYSPANREVAIWSDY